MRKKPGFNTLERYLRPMEKTLVDTLENPVLNNFNAPAAAAVIRRLCDELARYDMALGSLTPGGSEFIANPEMCVSFVNDYLRSVGIIRTVRGVNSVFGKLIDEIVKAGEWYGPILEVPKDRLDAIRARYKEDR